MGRVRIGVRVRVRVRVLVRVVRVSRRIVLRAGNGYEHTVGVRG